MKAYAKFDFDRVPQVASPMPHAAPEEEYSNFACNWYETLNGYLLRKLTFDDDAFCQR